MVCLFHLSAAAAAAEKKEKNTLHFGPEVTQVPLLIRFWSRRVESLELASPLSILQSHCHCPYLSGARKWFHTLPSPRVEAWANAAYELRVYSARFSRTATRPLDSISLALCICWCAAQFCLPRRCAAVCWFLLLPCRAAGTFQISLSLSLWRRVGRLTWHASSRSTLVSQRGVCNVVDWRLITRDYAIIRWLFSTTNYRETYIILIDAVMCIQFPLTTLYIY